MQWLSVSLAVACVVLALVGHAKWVKSLPGGTGGMGYTVLGVLCFFGILVANHFGAECNRYFAGSIAAGVIMFCLVRKVQWHRRHATECKAKLAAATTSGAESNK